MKRRARRHPVLGFFSGLVFGLGLALLLFTYGVLPMTVLWLGYLLLAGAILGIILAYVAPARGKQRPPT